MYILRLAIVAPKNMVWTVYDVWRSWDAVRTPCLFHTDDFESARAEAERAKKYAKAEKESSVDGRRVRVTTIQIIRTEPHAEDLR